MNLEQVVDAVNVKIFVKLLENIIILSHGRIITSQDMGLSVVKPVTVYGIVVKRENKTCKTKIQGTNQ